MGPGKRKGHGYSVHFNVVTIYQAKQIAPSLSCSGILSPIIIFNSLRFSVSKLKIETGLRCNIMRSLEFQDEAS